MHRRRRDHAQHRHGGMFTAAHGDLMGGNGRIDSRHVRFWCLIFLAFWALSTISNLSGPFDTLGLLPSLLFGLGEALVLLAVSLWIAHRHAQRR